MRITSSRIRPSRFALRCSVVKVARIAARGEQRDVAGERPELVEAGPALEGNDDVVAARAGRHRPRLEPEFAQQIADLDRRAAHRRRIVDRRIEIDDEPVRALRPVAPAEPGVERDARLAGKVDERRRLGRDDVLDGPAAGRHMRAGDPGREVRCGVLLDDPMTARSRPDSARG